MFQKELNSTLQCVRNSACQRLKPPGSGVKVYNTRQVSSLSPIKYSHIVAANCIAYLFSSYFRTPVAALIQAPNVVKADNLLSFLFPHIKQSLSWKALSENMHSYTVLRPLRNVLHRKCRLMGIFSLNVTFPSL